MHRDNGNGAGGEIAVGLTFLGNGVRRMQALSPQPVRTTGGIETLAMHGVLHQPCALLQVSEQPAAAGEIGHGLAVH